MSHDFSCAAFSNLTGLFISFKKVLWAASSASALLPLKNSMHTRYTASMLRLYISSVSSLFLRA